MRFKGFAHILGDDIDTDTLIPAKYCASFDPAILREHLLEQYDPDFKNRTIQGDIVFAGRNFGHGSSREHAPLALKAAGIEAVVVKSVARIFYRNAFNVGIPVIECPDVIGQVKNGDRIDIDVKAGVLKMNETPFQIAPIPDFMQRIIEKGGLVEYYSSRSSMPER